MRKLRKILLSLNSLRKALGNGLFFSALKNDYHIKIVDELSYKRVLVLSPHPDDEVFGCGGLISKLHNSGAQISVAYFCDGAGGTSDGKNKRNLIDVRKIEAKASAQILGIKSQTFFGYPDGKLAAGHAAVKGLTTLIKEFKPDIILVPSFLDNHPDHRVTNEILLNTLSEIENESPSTTLGTDLTIWAYEIWTPIYPNRLVDINSVIDTKKEAISKHKSQLDSRGYDKAVIALNQYRAEINNISGYAEAFFASSVEIYKELYRKS